MINILNNIMTIFSNDCTNAKYYQLNHIQYNHPLFWSLFTNAEYIKFVKNYNDINWDNYKIMLLAPLVEPPYPCKGHYYINVDNKFVCEYPHYTDNYIGAGYQGWDVVVPDAEKYTKEKYEIRLSRLTNEPPIFLYNQKKIDTIQDVLNFINLDIPYKKIVYTNFKGLQQYDNPNCRIIYKYSIDFSNSFKDFAKLVGHYF